MTERFPRAWFFYLIGKSLFYVVGIISLVFYGTAFLTVAESFGEYFIGFSCWFVLVLPYAINYFIAKKRKDKIQAVIEQVKKSGHYNPDQNSEYRIFWQSTYLGFDFERGTALYVRIYPGNVMDVIGFDAYSLVRTEVDGSKLSLYTKFPTLPMIPIKTGAASSIANHLHAMNNKGYSYNFDFNDFVNKKRAEIESLTGLPVPVLA
ncbi:plasmid IncI1-type surface exclusion protein ExcA [Lelliottia amnigena]|uniref:plasmid IncI1-type surface exclusion protein ExcA n=1 Tax=Lelliottia amnigena TaxID=61646 RepID=UPI001C22A7EA|nr:plasmid IncI1-type surface exclusion protein ExcA [Lelliottia amnigena]QXB24142.1 plasmid IncI1-type surface exclusion protein ExcA [Lelliottia amnigena]